MTALIEKLIRSPAFFCIIAVLAFIGIFEFLPTIEKAQKYVSLEDYKNLGTSCQDILAGRPRYGKLNHWFFAWIILTPAVIFLFQPNTRSRLRAIRTLFAITLCYIFMNLAVHLQWDIRNAPFGQDPFYPDAVNGWRMDCVNIADGFSLIFTFVMGWIPACIYTGLCLYLWRFYHRKYSHKIDKNYKNDILTSILYSDLRIYSALLVLFWLLLMIHKAGLFNAEILSLLYYLALRPLLIPIEIFAY